MFRSTVESPICWNSSTNCVAFRSSSFSMKILILCYFLRLFTGAFTLPTVLSPFNFDSPNLISLTPSAFKYVCSPPGGSGPNELYHSPTNRCYQQGLRGPCEGNQIFVEGPMPGHGICDCVPNLGLVYSNFDGRCYIENVQGPCPWRYWWILNVQGVPTCQPVPRGCPSDGNHVYWSRSDTEEPRCYQLGTRGPCAAGQIVARGIDDGSLTVSCTSLQADDLSSTSRRLAISPFIRCPRGSRRSQSGCCRALW